MFETASRCHGYWETQTRACWLEKQAGDPLYSAVCIGGGESKTEPSPLLRKASAKTVPPRNNFPVRADQPS